jgi:hypothetical protein
MSFSPRDLQAKRLSMTLHIDMVTNMLLHKDFWFAYYSCEVAKCVLTLCFQNKTPCEPAHLAAIHSSNAASIVHTYW